MYWLNPISAHIHGASKSLRTASSTYKLVLTSILAAITALLQAAGGFLPGFGYVISPIATFPVLICTVMSFRHGIAAYGVAIMLLIFIQPSELMVFPFTTGLLGLSLGISFYILKRRVCIIAFNGFVLVSGIAVLLYTFKFPVLGPTAASSFHFLSLVAIYIFSFLYCWMWVEITIQASKRWLRRKNESQ